MNHDLIERYIYAVTKRMNSKVREDVSLELKGLIEDMLLERCGDELPTEKDIRVVLTELGSPQELYAKYDEDATKCLIGQPYFSTYKLVLKIVLSVVAVGLTMACAVLQIVEPRAWYELAAFWFSTVFDSLISCFTLLTIVFAVMYRKEIKIDHSFDFDDLPPVPKKKQQISAWECITGIAFSVAFLFIFLAVPQLFSARFSETGEWIPIFDAQVFRSNWYILVLFTTAGVIQEAVKLMEKRYNHRVLVVTIATNLVSAVLCIWWLAGSQIMNPIFLENLGRIFVDDSQFLINLFEKFNVFFMGVMLLALVLDTVEAVLKLEK